MALTPRPSSFRKLVLAVLLGGAAALGACSDEPARAQQPAATTPQPTEALSIETPTGTHRFRIEVAVTPDQKATGLMFRRELAADAGMLFTYETPQIITMWMRNTYIPLDMIFIDSLGRVVSVAERTIPETLTTIPSAAPAVGVLEVPAGTAARLGIGPGARVIHPFFRTAPR